MNPAMFDLICLAVVFGGGAIGLVVYGLIILFKWMYK